MKKGTFTGRDGATRPLVFHSPGRIVIVKPGRPRTTRPNPWAVLHRRALAFRVTTQWLREWERTIPCGECKEEWKRLKGANPFRAADQFAWSVEAHNAVNAKLGKPPVTVDAARAEWTAAAHLA